jgi:D-alanine-D-alanine ligase
MRVALVYNQKKEDAAQQSTTEDAGDPPSLSEMITQPSLPSIPSRYTLTRSSDLYAEWDTFETIDAVRSALAERHQVTLIEADENAFLRLSAERPDIVFNIAEGLQGISRESQIPAMLEMLQIPYTGSDPLTLAICLDKSRAKEILTYHAIPTPSFTVVHERSEIANVPLRFPRIVKPLHEGSSKGIFNSSVVKERDGLERAILSVLQNYNEPALVEEFLEGREFTVAIIGNGADLTVLPIVEIKFDSLPEGVNPIYSYEAKWIWDRSEAPLDIFECPASLEEGLRREIESICRRAYRVLRCRDWCRIDVRLDGRGAPHILELNPLPGILPNPDDNSCFPKAARAAGLTYNGLLQTVLMLAARRNGLLGNTIPSRPMN